MPSRKWSIAAAVLLGMAIVSLYLAMARPPRAKWHPAKVIIPKGSNLPDIEKMFTEKGLLRYPLVFRILVIGTMTSKKLQHGEYAFPEPPSAIEVWRKIVSGEVAKYQVTIPDGSTIYDIAQILGTLELANPEDFLTAATSPDLANNMGIPGNTLEGYLFPDTYILVKNMPAEEIIGVMVRRFRNMFPAEMYWNLEENGFTLHQIVTIASIIEKETGVESEKPVISAIIRNRLSLGMRLQMDPTVIYGLKKFEGNLTRKDLRAPHPYNTYQKRGLPPGPISNPGLSSLQAAMEPVVTDYLYFVSRNDGSHQFSRNLQEHNLAVAVYQKGKNAKMAREDGPAEKRDSREAVSTPPPRP